MYRNEKTISKPTLVDQVASLLEDRIINKYYPAGSQIPIEDLLGKEFSTSRTTIRSAVDRLISKNLLIRKHGIGTFVVDSPKILDPLDEFIDFQELIKRNGFEPRYHKYSIKEVRADKQIQKIFNLKEGATVLEVLKYWTADGKPVVFCINHIPINLFPDSSLKGIDLESLMTEPLTSFYESTLSEKIKNYIADIRCGLVQESRFDLFESHYEPTTPMLIIDQTGLNQQGVAIHHSIEYHPNNIMKFSLNRRII